MDDIGELIKTYRIKKRQNARGQHIWLPPAWCDDVGIKEGDVIEIYRRGAKLSILKRPS
jgi:bifunctional DNA-binding transcriptional regulator/antitoxin component of YhaV-PrlF toxin-antitoxin module